jgi:hypothetical protein
MSALSTPSRSKVPTMKKFMNGRKPLVHKAVMGTSKFRSSSVLSEKWKLFAAAEVRKVQHRLGTSGQPISRQDRARRCSLFISDALQTASADDMSDFPNSNFDISQLVRLSKMPLQRTTSQTPAPFQQQPKASEQEQLKAQSDYGYEDCTTAQQKAQCDYGYEDHAPQPPHQRRNRYQRRCSVTEFSLKAVAIARVQLEAEGRGSR